MQKDYAGSSNFIERREGRASFDAYARARHGYRRTFPKIVDLSANGVKLWMSAHPAPGKTIWLSLPTLAAKNARIVWDNGFLVGCEFFRPLHPAIFDHLVQVDRNASCSGSADARAVWALRSVA